MPSRSGFALLLIAVAVAVGIVALLSPWWTIAYVPHGGDDGVRQVGPFDSANGVVRSGTALLSGWISVCGLIALVASIALLAFGLRTNRVTAVTSAPLVTLSGVALLVLALVFVIFAYPDDVGGGVSFWGGDVESQPPTGYTRADAAYGWYLGVAAVFIAGAGAALALRAKGTDLDAQAV